MTHVTLMAVGDTAPYIEPPESIFQNVKQILSEADIRFVQVERTFSDRGTQFELSSSPHTKVSPHLISAYTWAGFDVAGLATNHSMDFGPVAALDTIENFKKHNIKTIGTGANIADARKPAIIDKKGIRIAFLGYCSVLLPQYWATENRAGVAPIRAHTYYAPYEFQPGAPARVFTVAEKEDIEAMQDDIRKIRSEVDFVVCSMHWGVHWVPRYIADYQIEVGHAAIDAGCDLIIGHHAHLLKGIEIYKNKPIIYSLGNFAMSRSPGAMGYCIPEGKYTFAEVYDIHISPDYTYKHKDFYHHSAIAKTEFSMDGNLKLSMIPVFIEDGPKPTVVQPVNKRFTEIVKLIEWSSEQFGTQMKVENGELKISI